MLKRIVKKITGGVILTFKQSNMQKNVVLLMGRIFNTTQVIRLMEIGRG